MLAALSQQLIPFESLELTFAPFSIKYSIIDLSRPD